MKLRPDPVSPGRIKDDVEPELVSGSTADCAQQKTVSIWPLVAAMDYMLVELQEMSPMSAHCMRMARQNLLDEYFAAKSAEG
ncbi:MAG: hypothetical protein ACPW61_05045 [Methyloligella sp. ZOD6]